MTSRFHGHGAATVPHGLLHAFLILRRHYTGSFVNGWNTLLALRSGPGGGALGRKGNLLPARTCCEHGQEELRPFQGGTVPQHQLVPEWQVGLSEGGCEF